MTTTTETRAKFKRIGQQDATYLRALARPVPASVAKAIGTPGDEHQALAARYGEAQAAVIACERRLAEAQERDRLEAAKAVASGQPIGKAKAARVEDELLEQRRQLGILAETIPASAQVVLDAALAVAGDVAAECEREADERELAAAELLRDARQALADSGRLRVEASWCGTLQNEHAVAPFMADKLPSSHARSLIDEALLAVEREAEWRREYVAEREHAKRAANSVLVGNTSRELPPVPDYAEGRRLNEAKAASRRRE
jgi:hypothetical protein